MALKRSIYADRDGLMEVLAGERDRARINSALGGLPKYRRYYWTGRIEALDYAIALLRDWAGEIYDESQPPEMR